MTALAALALWAANGSASPVSVSIRATGDLYSVSGRFDVDASTSIARDVLTDYGDIPRFVSSIKTSRVLELHGASAVVEQEGRARFLFFSAPVRLVLRVRVSPGRVEFRDIGSPQVRRYQGSWTIMPAGRGCVVAYELTAEPAAGLAPRFVTRRALKAGARRLLRDVRGEIRRRGRA